MAGGINHAKKIVLDEACGLAKKLENGHAGNSETQGQAIALLVKMISPLYAAEFVTMEECRRQHTLLRKKDPDRKPMRINLGPLKLEGNFSPVVLMALFMVIGIGCLIYALGKSEAWW